MPAFSGKEFDEISSWAFGHGEGVYVFDTLLDFCCISPASGATTRVNVERAEAEHAIRVLGCISGAFKTQGESNT
jgi:hypothetical protein